jgi:hypothetical protein
VERLRGLGVPELLTSYLPADGGPEGFYKGYGFVDTGEVDAGEVVCRLEIDGSEAVVSSQMPEETAPVLDERSFARWLHSFRRGREDRDADALGEMFTADARYYVDPFSEPEVGSESVVVALIGDVASSRWGGARFEVLAVSGDLGVARWLGTSQHVPGVESAIDGILTARFTGTRCRELREWWHAGDQGAGFSSGD